MTQAINAADLIINKQGRIYHIDLKPSEIASTIILVGDPQRVSCVSQYFDTLEVKRSHREFITHTGYIGNKRLSVVSTGISTANIDIVLNEIDALWNIDFETRQPKANLTTLEFIRIGTAGCMQASIEPGRFVASRYAVGLDNLQAFYPIEHTQSELALQAALQNHCQHVSPAIQLQFVGGSDALLKQFDQRCYQGITLTCPGFYAPQARHLRLPSMMPSLFEQLLSFNYQNEVITNFEMETSAIYGLARAFGHQFISLSVMLNNRVTGVDLTNKPYHIDQLIQHTLEQLTVNNHVAIPS